MTIRSFDNIAPTIDKNVFVDESALIIGDVHLGEDSSAWPMTVVRGDVNKIRIGARTNIQDNSVLHVTHYGDYAPGGYALTIGNNVTIGHRVTLHGCTIEDSCLIGMSATVMDGAILHRNVLLAAGSLVTPNKELEGGYLWKGNPAKKARELTEQELSFFDYSAQHYVQLKNKYLMNN